MTGHDPIRDLLDGLRPARPPASLRRRALGGAAAVTPPVPEPHTDLWIRIRASTPWRLAWATAVAALVLAHVVVSLPPDAPEPPPHGETSPLLVAGLDVPAELSELLDLPALAADGLPLLDRAPGAADSERTRSHDS